MFWDLDRAGSLFMGHPHVELVGFRALGTVSVRLVKASHRSRIMCFETPF